MDNFAENLSVALAALMKLCRDAGGSIEFSASDLEADYEFHVDRRDDGTVIISSKPTAQN